MRLFFPIAALFFGLLQAAGAFAQQPACYATPEGNDRNDGSNWAVAKADIMACYDALPRGGGAIFVRDSGTGHPVQACKPTDPPGCGIWLMQYNDPNYALPPAGWRKLKPNILITGVAGGNGAGAFAHGGQVSVAAGGNDPNHPALWMDGSSGMKIENLSFQSTCFPAKLGLDSAGSAARGGIWNLYLENDYFFVNHVPGCGPGILVGGESAWDFIKDSQISGNPKEFAGITSVFRSANVVTVTTHSPLPASWRSGMTIGIVGVKDPGFNGGRFTATVTGAHTFTYRQNGPKTNSTGGLASSDQAQAIVLDPKGGFGSGLIFLQNAFLVSGGVKVYSDRSGSGLYAENLLQESGVTPGIWVASCVSPMYGNFKNITISDAFGRYAGVRVDCAPSFANRIMVQSAEVDGPATLLGGAGPTNSTESPLLQGQQGIWNGYLMGQTNAARRGFGPVNSRFPNLISVTEPLKCGPPLTCTPGSAPDGTNNATLITAKNSAGLNLYFNLSQPVAAGDIFIYGAWLKSLKPPGFFSNATNPLNCSFVSYVNTANAWTISHGSPQVANGEWDWIWGAFKIAYASASKGQLVFSSNVGDKGIGVYAPVLIRIPAGTVSDNEAIEYAETLQPFRHDASPGQVSLLPGEQFKADSIQVGSGPTITSGLGAPKESAPIGSIYLRRDGASGSTFYIYENAGWKAQF